MFSLIVAKTNNGVIGRNGDLPWNISEEMMHYREITRGSVAIMGKKTADSIIRKRGSLPSDKVNLVLTRRRPMPEVSGGIVCGNLEDAFKIARSHGLPIFVIGGGEVYVEVIGMENLRQMHISEIRANYDGDVRFPGFDLSRWHVQPVITYPSFDYVIYTRKSKPGTTPVL